MFKLTLVISLIICQHVVGQMLPALEGKPPLNFSTQSDTVPNWLRAIHLLPNECVALKHPKIMDYIYLPLLITFQAAIPKSILNERKDSLRKSAALFVGRMRKTLHLNKTSKVVISILYFDRYRCNAGLSRRLVYFINGRKTIVTDTTFNDSLFMDSAVSSRIERFELAPNQYFLTDHNNQALALCNITSQCYKDQAVPGDSQLTRARIAALTILFEILKLDFPKYKSVAFACIDPLGERKVEANEYELEKMDLPNHFNELFQDYLMLQR